VVKLSEKDERGCIGPPSAATGHASPPAVTPTPCTDGSADTRAVCCGVGLPSRVGSG
jgi:hypothetical protein